MNWDQLEGKWKQYTGSVKERWGKLTDDDLTLIRGKRDLLIGVLQERYGIAKQEAEAQVDEFTRNMRLATRKITSATPRKVRRATRA